MDPRERLLRVRVKNDFRKRMRALRKALPREARAARSARITEAALALPELAAPGRVLAFSPIRGEVELGPLLEALRARGATIALPRVVPESNELTLHVHEAGDPLEESGWGILEPTEDAPRVDGLDVVLVPCLAIDLSGQRIGYGRGFYDRMLSEHPEALRVALAYDFQLLAEAPAFDHDVPVHVVVTDARVVRVGEGD